MKPYVLFVHPIPLESWGPEKLDREGLTGSEEVVVSLTRELARNGYRVAVATGDFGVERIVDGVRWMDVESLSNHWKLDVNGSNTVLVVSSLPQLANAPEVKALRARLRLFWAHSIRFDDATPETWRAFDGIVCATDWQATQMCYRYTMGLCARTVIPYGIVPPPPLPKVPGKCLYASSPDRGLLRLLRWWPEIRAARPDLTLFVAYGRDRMRGRAKVDPNLATELAEIDRLIVQPGVTDLGFVSKPEMDRHIAESELWLYPTDFEETGCLIGRRAVSAGCRAVYVGQGCLREVLAPWIPVGDGFPSDMEQHRKAFVAVATARVSTPMPRLHGLPWSEVAAQWDSLLDPTPTAV